MVFILLCSTFHWKEHTIFLIRYWINYKYIQFSVFPIYALKKYVCEFIYQYAYTWCVLSDDCISIRLSFLTFCFVTAAVYWFKIRLWHVRCMQYIIGAATSWIAHLMLWMCQYYEVLPSDLTAPCQWTSCDPCSHTHRDIAMYVCDTARSWLLFLTKLFTHVQFVQCCGSDWRCILLQFCARSVDRTIFLLICRYLPMFLFWTQS